MGYFSQMAIEQTGAVRCDREWTPPRPGASARREFLEYQLGLLHTKLENLELWRTHDPLDPDYDRTFYSDIHLHYYEDPERVQDILHAIGELEELLADLTYKERGLTETQLRLAAMDGLGRNLDNQLLMVSYWDYAAFFREAGTYRKLLSVLKEQVA